VPLRIWSKESKLSIVNEFPIPLAFEELLNDSRTQRFSTGSLLIQEDAPTSSLYILLKGRVRVFKIYGKTKVPLATLGPGEIVGELAMLSTQARSASVEAISPVIALTVQTSGLRDKISPPWILPVLQVVAERLRLVNQSLASLRNLNEFAKKSFRKDYNAEFIVRELLRFCKTFCALIQSHHGREIHTLTKAHWQTPLKETLDTIQSPLIDDKLFDRAARFCGLLSEDHAIDSEHLYALKAFLEKLDSREEDKLPTLSCLRLMEESIAAPSEKGSSQIRVNPHSETFQKLPLYKEALVDFSKLSIVEEDAAGNLVAEREELTQFWIHMRFVKAFDFSDFGF
jgi:CRP-like cAMP-binding protein